ncbi:beta-lactamase/transpeptidase-like protein [Hyaloraphidium curvatum]|nr:beta-lactamase/transpeptidase-like protein [Hyaloraphidium curvatum]
MADTSKIIKVLDDAIAAGVPGITSGILRDGKLVFHEFRGKLGPGRTEDVAADSIFSVMSMTKAVTSLCIAQLIERGKLTLDTEVGEILPSFKNQKIVHGFTEAGEPILEDPKRRPTIRHLATHTSGMALELVNPNYSKYIQKTGHPGLGTYKKAHILEAPLFWEPGTKWEYSTGIETLGLIVEALEGKKLGEYMRENIFEPLGMVDSQMKPDPAKADRTASSALHMGDQFVPFTLPSAPFEAREFEGGGGDMFSTVKDYLAFLQCLLDGGVAPNGKRIIKEETIKELMFSDVMEPGASGHIGRIPTGVSTYEEAWDGLEKGHTLGFCLTKQDSPLGPKAGSLCWDGLLNTYYAIDPASQIVMMVWMQYLPFADPTAQKIRDEFFKATYETFA